MTEKQLSLEQRVEALEAKIVIIGTGLSAILTELAGVGEAQKVEAEGLWDSTKIQWVEAEGQAGPYEKSDDINNRDFKAMLKDLGEHQGKLTRGDYFYWTFTNGATVGRKKRKR